MRIPSILAVIFSIICFPQFALAQTKALPAPTGDINFYPLFLLVLGIAFIFVLILYLRVHAFLALIGAALLVGLLSPEIIFKTVGGEKILNIVAAPRLVATQFGETMRKIGLAVAFATIIGKAMMDSGAADRIVRFFTKLFGERFAPMALLASGFILSIPVFFDNVFLLLVPLAKALRVRTGKDYLLYITAIGAGGAVTHSMVPPTPGPIGMSEALNVPMGMTIIMGLVIGTPMALVGFAYASWINRRLDVPLRQAGGASLEEMEARARVEDRELPSLGMALLPILLPVLLITSDTVFDAIIGANPGLKAAMTRGEMVELSNFGGLLDFLGEPSIALLISAIVSMAIVVQQKKLNRKEMTIFTAQALDDAGMILLITSAGGAFGGLLYAVGVGETLRAVSNQAGISLLVLAWILAALFKIAQGSGTVSMLTTSQIIAAVLAAELNLTNINQLTPEAVGGLLGYHPVYLVMAIGAGSKIGSWMNDSGFWVVSRMGGLTETETFRSWTLCLVSMGCAGLPIIWVLSQMLPLI